MIAGLKFYKYTYEKATRQDGVDVLAQHVAVDGLVTPALIRPPSGRRVARILLGGLAEPFVGLAPCLELPHAGVAGHGGDDESYQSANPAHRGHRYHGHTSLQVWFLILYNSQCLLDKGF
jgi:hypothetical protein